jgi:ubiquitin-protein ligase
VQSAIEEILESKCKSEFLLTSVLENDNKIDDALSLPIEQ